MVKIKRQDLWVLQLQLTTLEQQFKIGEQLGQRLLKGVQQTMDHTGYLIRQGNLYDTWLKIVWQQCKHIEKKIQFLKRIRLPAKEKQRRIAPIYRRQQRCILLNDQIFREFRELRRRVQERLLNVKNRHEMIKMNQENQFFWQRQCFAKATELDKLRKEIYH